METVFVLPEKTALASSQVSRPTPIASITAMTARIALANPWAYRTEVRQKRVAFKRSFHKTVS